MPEASDAGDRVLDGDHPTVSESPEGARGSRVTESGGDKPAVSVVRTTDPNELLSIVRSLEDSKVSVVNRIRKLRYELNSNIRAREQAQAEMADAGRLLDEANDRIGPLEMEVTSLRAEFDAAQAMLDEIEETFS